MLWLFIIILGSLAAAIALVVVIGMALPQNHRAARTARFSQAPATVWSAITDHASEPTWRGDIVKKERLDDRDGHAVWRETRKRGDTMTLETMVFEPPRRMVGRIADEKLPFGGTWTYEIAPVDGGSACTLTITEDGEIYNPVFRFVARFLIGYQGTMNGYLAALSRKFGREPAFAD